MKYIVSGGGTGGHIYPAIAIIEEIQARDKEADILYIGNPDSMEERIAKEKGLNFKGIRVMGMPRKINLKFFKGLVEMTVGLGQSLKIVRKFGPDCMIGTGGFVSGPILLAGAFKKKKTVIHEQNSLPGITNRLLSKFVDRVCVTYEASIRYFDKPERAVVTGNPIRESFDRVEATDEMYEKYGLNKELPIVFFFGGSNGSEKINKTVAEMIKEKEDLPFQIIHATGQDNYDSFIEELGSKKDLDNISINPYLYDIASAYGICDLVITSSGAITLAEISNLALASILIPKAYTAENHQEFNARLYQQNGASDMILESELNSDILYEKILNILNNENSLKLMGENAKKLANPKAKSDIVDEIEKLIQGGSNGGK